MATANGKMKETQNLSIHSSASIPARSVSQHSLLHRFLRSRRASFGVIAVLLILFSALAANQLAPYDPQRINPLMRTVPPLGISRIGTFHLLGTDQGGRDILSRILFGGRISLGISWTAALLAAIPGLFLGLVSGYYGGWLDGIIMRIADVQLAIPTVLLAIFVATALGPSIPNMILVLAISSWVMFARTVRATTLLLRELPFTEAAKCIGVSDPGILWRHVLRNGWTPIIIIATQQMATLITLESSLSFLGLGVPAGTPSWGTMVAEGREYMMTDAWWLAAFPGLAISLSVLSINFLGDGLRDVLDARLRL